MSLPGVNLSFTLIKAELGRGSNSPLDLDDPEVRKLANTGLNNTQSMSSGQPVKLSNLRGKARVTRTVSATALKQNMLTIATASGNYVTNNTWATVTINSGVIIGSDDGTVALTLNGNTGDIMELVNYGIISGKGGTGGNGGSGEGTEGTNALNATYRTAISNYAAIWGGGGGGGGGADGGDGSKYPAFVGGGAGGGGAGYVGGAGGTGGNGGGQWAGGAGIAPGGTAGAGGDGGGPGLSGGDGGASGAGGKAAGYYLVGSTNVNWLVTGDVRGRIG
jgi:hypothetical protein